MSFVTALPQPLLRPSVYLPALILLAAALPIRAQPISSGQSTATASVSSNAEAPGQGQGQGWGVRLGYFDDYRNATLVYETPTWWSHKFENGWGRIDLNGELGVTYWDATKGDPQSLWQLSATPILRWWPNEFIYTEIGVGATVLSRTTFADRHFGSAFQFGNHIGVGAVINKSHQVGLRFSHFSNARIKEPNDGLDIVQLSYTYRY